MFHAIVSRLESWVMNNNHSQQLIPLPLVITSYLIETYSHLHLHSPHSVLSVPRLLLLFALSYYLQCSSTAHRLLGARHLTALIYPALPSVPLYFHC